MAPVDDSKLEDFDRTLAVNVRAVFVATQAAVKHMREGERIQYRQHECRAHALRRRGLVAEAAAPTAFRGLAVFTFEDKLA